jgi:hypothetical protein
VTADEAAKLQPGDRVMTPGGVRVVAFVLARQVVRVAARRDGVTRAGKRYPIQVYRPQELSRAGHLDPEPANVYADFLEECGEPRAAALLRAAFPLGPPAEDDRRSGTALP